MGVAASSALLLGDAVSKVETFIDVFIVLYSVALILYIVSSWVRLPYSVALNRFQRFLFDVADPYLRLFRRLLPMAGPLDLSPLVAFVMLGVIDRLAHYILDHVN